jgi:hypothetical protein
MPKHIHRVSNVKMGTPTVTYAFPVSPVLRGKASLYSRKSKNIQCIPRRCKTTLPQKPQQIEEGKNHSFFLLTIFPVLINPGLVHPYHFKYVFKRE